ncbi:hypothetical protein V1506DRAFT_531944 [Lipomyces tetrasporus]
MRKQLNLGIFLAGVSFTIWIDSTLSQSSSSVTSTQFQAASDVIINGCNVDISDMAPCNCRFRLHRFVFSELWINQCEFVVCSKKGHGLSL